MSSVQSSALLVKTSDLSLGKGRANRRSKGEGRHMLEATSPPVEVLRLGPCDVSGNGGAVQADGIARLNGKARFVAAVDGVLLLPGDSIFFCREIVTFL